MNVGAGANMDMIHITTNHRIAPHRDISAEDRLTDDLGAGMDIRAGVNLWMNVVMRNDIHD